MKTQTHIPVFYEGQDDLIEILATSICSVCYNTTSFIDFFILDCGISNINKKILKNLKQKFNNFSIEFIPIDLKQFNGLKGWGQNRKFVDCYSRLLIPNLKQDIHKAIYFDSDIMALDDINKLYSIDLENFAIGLAPDLGCDIKIFDNCINNLGVSPKHIFANAGVIILNCDLWRKNKITDKLLTLAREKKDYLNVIIEELFCIYFSENQYKMIDLRYCISDRINYIKNVNADFITDEYVLNEWNNAVIQHITPIKMWKYLKNSNNKECKNFSLFWFFLSLTPYYYGVMSKYIFNIIENSNIYSKKNIYKISFLKIIPIYITKTNHSIKYKLFNKITILKYTYKY